MGESKALGRQMFDPLPYPQAGKNSLINSKYLEALPGLPIPVLYHVVQLYDLLGGVLRLTMDSHMNKMYMLQRPCKNHQGQKPLSRRHKVPVPERFHCHWSTPGVLSRVCLDLAPLVTPDSTSKRTIRLPILFTCLPAAPSILLRPISITRGMAIHQSRFHSNIIRLRCVINAILPVASEKPHPVMTSKRGTIVEAFQSFSRR